MFRCSHTSHEFSNGVWMGRLTPLSCSEVSWELCTFLPSPPMPDGVVFVKYRCTKCTLVLNILGFYRFFPEGNGFFHEPLDLRAMQVQFRDHLVEHLDRREQAGFFPVREDFDL